jgi:hypothetical protein
MPDVQRAQGASINRRWRIARRRNRSERCVACGEQIASAESAVEIQGHPFHAGCALYSRRRR